MNAAGPIAAPTSTAAPSGDSGPASSADDQGADPTGFAQALLAALGVFPVPAPQVQTPANSNGGDAATPPAAGTTGPIAGPTTGPTAGQMIPLVIAAPQSAGDVAPGLAALPGSPAADGALATPAGPAGPASPAAGDAAPSDPSGKAGALLAQLLKAAAGTPATPPSADPAAQAVAPTPPTAADVAQAPVEAPPPAVAADIAAQTGQDTALVAPQMTAPAPPRAETESRGRILPRDRIAGLRAAKTASDPVAQASEPALAGRAVNAGHKDVEGALARPDDDDARAPDDKAKPADGDVAAKTDQPALAVAQTDAARSHAAQVKAGPETVAGLAAQIVHKLGDKTTRFEVQLDPHGLGKVDVKVEINSRGELSAALNFENPQAAQELHARASELHTALQQAGFDLGKTALHFSAGDPSGQGAWNQNPQQGRESAPIWDRRAFTDLADIPLAGARAPGRAARSGGVDVTI